jgi:hypothetical protein
MKSRRAASRRDAPSKRPLKIYSSDPMAGRTAGNWLSVDVPFEPLRPGPTGRRIKVVDYDGEQDCYYTPVDLDEPQVLIQGGLEPSESDPRFHQQMVYVVAMRVIENFERALGRTVDFAEGGPLRLFPHAFYGANAFYDRELKGIVFGYFRADLRDPGPNLPGQTVFTCLSHDIIAHEMTHALVDRLRPHFLEPSNRDVLAFHEGFSDIVALFQHFSFEGGLRDHILISRTDLRKRDLLVGLAQQFGQARGTGKALRSALDDAQQSKKLYDSLAEPHGRGAILVAALFDGFFNIYQRRIRDLIRIATGGTGNLPDADLHPDLVNRVAAEAASTAQSVLNMCIRAFDYMPPVDVSFGDFLRGMITADYELNPIDTYGQRGAMIDAFRLRGIYPSGVVSLAEESLLWERPPARLPPVPLAQLGDLLMRSVGRFTRRHMVSSGSAATDDLGEGLETSRGMTEGLHSYAVENAVALGLDASRRILVHAFHWVFRVGRNNQLVIELVAQFIQSSAGFGSNAAKKRVGGLTYRGGTTIIASADGTVRYIVAKPIAPAKNFPRHLRKEAKDRLSRQIAYMDECDLSDPRMAWCDDDYLKERGALRMKLMALHERI